MIPYHLLLRLRSLPSPKKKKKRKSNLPRVSQPPLMKRVLLIQKRSLPHPMSRVYQRDRRRTIRISVFEVWTRIFWMAMMETQMMIRIYSFRSLRIVSFSSRNGLPRMVRVIVPSRSMIRRRELTSTRKASHWSSGNNNSHDRDDRITPSSARYRLPN